MERKILGSIKAFIEQRKKRKRKDALRKLQVLYRATYDFYLTLYLIDVAVNKKVDLPPFMYLSGEVVCQSAQNNAIKAIEDNIIKSGMKKLNRCFKAYIKDRKRVIRGC